LAHFISLPAFLGEHFFVAAFFGRGIKHVGGVFRIIVKLPGVGSGDVLRVAYQPGGSFLKTIPRSDEMWMYLKRF
jgi:hypothetical protein